MAEAKAEPPKVVIKKRPTIFITRNNKVTLLPGRPLDPAKITLLSSRPLDPAKKCLNSPAYKEQTIYSTINNSDNPRQGDFRSIVLKNQLDALSNNSRTVATFVTYDNKRIEKTSDKITRLIGKKNYDNIFVALCSVINQELKIQAILALLTEDTPDELLKPASIPCKDCSCQTDDISKEIFYKKKVRPKRRAKPMIVASVKMSTPKKIIIHPSSMGHQNRPSNKNEVDVNKTQSLPELSHLQLDEDSNGSAMSSSQLSICSDILSTEVTRLMSATDNSIKMDIDNQSLNCAEKKLPKTEAETFGETYNPFVIETVDRSRIIVPVKPEDQFHLATPEILKHITSEERKKLLWHQAYIDWKLCLERDDDENMPLHLAVVHDDVDLIRRQCLVLRARGQSVDIAANGMTALQMSIKNNADPACTRTLLEGGASPLRRDCDARTALHQAVDGRPAHLTEILAFMAKRARELLEEYPELQYPGILEKSNEELAKHLLLQASVQYDRDGYTPLILAAKVGNPEAVALLAAAAPQAINTGMPNSGNTALYTAVAEACLNAVERGNRSQVASNYVKTLTILIEHGADPEIENRAGSKVSDLLQEFNINSLSLLIAQKVTSRFYGDAAGAPDNCDTFMLLKDKEGSVRLLSKAEADKGGHRARRLANLPPPPSKVEIAGQGDVNKGKKISVPTNSLASTPESKSIVTWRHIPMPKADSFENGVKKSLVVPKNVRFVRPDCPKVYRAVKGNKGIESKLSSQPKFNTNCIIIKNEKIADGAPVVARKAEVANVGDRHLIPAVPRSSYPSPKRSMSPGNCSLPEMSKEKCAKRKSRVPSAEKDRGDSKKLKPPEG